LRIFLSTLGKTAAVKEKPPRIPETLIISTLTDGGVAGEEERKK
jgi:hypothetical protein